MKDREARSIICDISRAIGLIHTKYEYFPGTMPTSSVIRDSKNELNKKISEISEKFDALMTHLNLEFEDIKPGIRVRKKK